jgi:XTP/dITP diphosphohydrolase
MIRAPQKVVLASGNAGKLKEFQSLLGGAGMEIVPQSDFDTPEVAETGLSFVENAIIKARFACAHTGLPAIADDSGLAVDALKGAPGIYSARYASMDKESGHNDQDNNEKLIHALAGLPDTERGARFICCLVFMSHAEDPCPIICHGQWQGQILTAPKGEQGFGYDPLFWLPELGCASAELAKEEKNRISHRGLASQLLLQALQEQFG